MPPKGQIKSPEKIVEEKTAKPRLSDLTAVEKKSSKESLGKKPKRPKTRRRTMLTTEAQSVEEMKPKTAKEKKSSRRKTNGALMTAEGKTEEEEPKKKKRPKKRRENTTEMASTEESTGKNRRRQKAVEERKKRKSRRRAIKEGAMMTAEGVTEGDDESKKKKKSKEEKSAENLAQKTKNKKMEELPPGEIINSDKHKWKIVQLLGAGGFGSVYKVALTDRPEDGAGEMMFAMKTERKDGDRNKLRLKVEVMVLMDLHKAKRRNHFTQLFDRGMNESLKFMVMTLVGPSLDQLRREYIQNDFSRATVMNVALQSLESLADLHDIGWIHRDIKPQNFTIGLGEQETTIFVLDFGICRKIFEKGSRQMKTPRLQVKFLGTMRYCPRNCHRCAEQHRGDDLESWIYMLFDLFDVLNGLPWRRERQEPTVIQLKSQFMAGQVKTCFNQAPKEFSGVIKYVSELGYNDEPDYSHIKKMLLDIAEGENIKLDTKLDWIGVERKEIWMPKKEEQKKEEEQQKSDGAKQQGEDMRTEEKNEETCDDSRKKKA